VVHQLNLPRPWRLDEIVHISSALEPRTSSHRSCESILTRLANTKMPEAYEDGGKWVGVATTIGFAVAFTVHAVD